MLQTDTQIRSAVAEDAPAIWSIGLAVHDTHLDALPGLFQPSGPAVWPVEHIVTLLDAPDQIVIVAVQNDSVIGYAHAELQELEATSLKLARRRLYLHQIGVAASHRRQKVGTALLHAMQKAAEERSVDDIMLHVYAFNDEARDFYRAHGFTLFSEQLWMPRQKSQARSAI